MGEENTIFSGPILQYLNLQLLKYLFQCLALGALSGHAKDPMHPMGGTSRSSLAGRTEALETKVQAKAIHFARWNERDLVIIVC